MSTARMCRRLLVALVVMLSFTGLPSATASVEPPLAAVPAASDVAGHARLPDGSAAEGTRVAVAPLDDYKTEAANPADRTLPILGAGTADSAGGFALTLTATPDVIALAQRNGGVLNLMVIALYPSTTRSYLEQRASFVSLSQDGLIAAASRPVDIQFDSKHSGPSGTCG